MDNKFKLILILGSILIIFIIGLVLFSKTYSPKTTPIEQPKTGPTAPERTLPPTDFTPPETKQPVGTSTGQELRNNTRYIFSSPNDKKDLAEKISESLKESDYPDQVNWVSYATSDNKQVSLSDFSKAAKIRIDPRFDGLLDEYNYDRVICKNSSGGLDYGLVINNKIFDSRPNLKQDELAILKSLEPYLLRDFHKILFPNVPLSEEHINQKLTFKDGKYRYAEVSLPDNKKAALDYHLLVDSIIFTNSLECMDIATKQIEAID